MKFLWTTIHVSNLDKSVQFYQDIVGLPVNRRYQARPGVEIAFMGDGETKVELLRNEVKTNITIGQDISMGFEVESLDTKITFMKEKGVAFDGPFQPAPYIKFIYVTDPDGAKIQFIENIK